MGEYTNKTETMGEYTNNRKYAYKEKTKKVSMMMNSIMMIVLW